MYIKLVFSPDELNTLFLIDREKLVIDKLIQSCAEYGDHVSGVGLGPYGDRITCVINGLEYDFITDQPGFWGWLYSRSPEYLTGRARYVILYSTEPDERYYS